MQPYVFPYIGYHQLMHAADVFVLLDDVNFIKKGWINRNRLRLNGEAHTFTIPIQGLSQHATIRASMIAPDPSWKAKLLGQLRHAYGKAPGFARHFPPIAAMVEQAQGSIADLAAESIRYVARTAGLATRIHLASDAGLDPELKGQERIIALAQRHGAERYINPANGAGLYSEERFTAAGIELRFLRMDGDLHYMQQGPAPFIQGLSIIDVLMNVDDAELERLLGRYQLFTAAELAATERPGTPSTA